MKIIDDIISREGGYSNHPSDTGGATMYGITEKVARQYGYQGEMKNLPRQVAEKIYMDIYWIKPGWDKVAMLSVSIAGELCDTGVNMGTGTAGKFLQRALNALNAGGEYYSDLLIDGRVGETTIAALHAYLTRRKSGGESVLLKALNCLQGERYISLCEDRVQNEDFLYGWLDKRI